MTETENPFLSLKNKNNTIQAVEQEKERHKKRMKEEKNMNKRMKNKLKKEAGLEIVEEEYNEGKDLIKEIAKQRRQFRDNFYSIINLITGDKNRICINEVITIRDKSIYTYHTSNKYKLSSILRNDNLIDGIVEHIDNENEKEKFRNVVEKLKSWDISYNRFRTSKRMNETDSCYVIFNPSRSKYWVFDKDEYNNKNKVEEKMNSSRYRRMSCTSKVTLTLRSEGDIISFCKYRESLYSTTKNVNQELRNQLEDEKELFESIIREFKTQFMSRKIQSN